MTMDIKTVRLNALTNLEQPVMSVLSPDKLAQASKIFASIIQKSQESRAEIPLLHVFPFSNASLSQENSTCFLDGQKGEQVERGLAPALLAGLGLVVIVVIATAQLRTALQATLDKKIEEETKSTRVLDASNALSKNEKDIFETIAEQTPNIVLDSKMYTFAKGVFNRLTTLCTEALKMIEKTTCLVKAKYGLTLEENKLPSTPCKKWQRIAHAALQLERKNRINDIKKNNTDNRG